MLKLKANER